MGCLMVLQPGRCSAITTGRTRGRYQKCGGRWGFRSTAEKIAEAVRSSGIQVAFFHGSLNEQITARVAAMRPAAIQINVNHGTEMDVNVFDGWISIWRRFRIRAAT